MALHFVLDENLRGPLMNAISRHHLSGGLSIDAVRVGDHPELPLGIKDPELLKWCEQSGRLLVSQDYDTLPIHLAKHLAEGRHVPGVLLVRPGSSYRNIVSHLELIAHAATAADYQDNLEFIPI